MSCILSELNKLIFKRLQASLENEYGTCQKHSLVSGMMLRTEPVLCVKLSDKLALTLKLLAECLMLIISSYLIVGILTDSLKVGL